MQSNPRRLRKLVTSGIAILIATSVFGLALAQTQPFFRFNFSPSPSTVLVPPEVPPVAAFMDFGNPGSETAYLVRSLVGDEVSFRLNTTGGTAPITWLPAPTLVDVLNFEDGLISGIPLVADNRVVVFEAQDATGTTAKARVTFDIYNAQVDISQFRSTVRLGGSYYGVVTSNVADANYEVDLAGMTVTAPDTQSRSVLGGTATSLGTFPVRVDVNRFGTVISAYAETQVTVVSPLSIAFNPSSVPAIPTAISVTATPQNVVGTPTLESLTPAATLAGRGLTYSNGVLSGNLTEGAAITLDLRLTDSADGATVTASYPIPAIANQPASIVVAPSGRPNQNLTASQGSASPATIVTSVSNPVCTVTQAVPGVTVTSDCQITGAPTTPGQYTLGISIVPAADPGATPITTTATITVHPTLVATGTNFNGAPGQGVTIPLLTSGIVGTPTFEISNVTEAAMTAAGLAFDPTTGGVTGVIDRDVSLSYTVRLTDSQDGASTTHAFSVISGAATMTPDAPLALRAGQTRTLDVDTTIVDPEFEIVDGPSYVTVNATTGELTVVAPAASQMETIPPVTLRATASARRSLSTTSVIPMGTFGPGMTLTIAPNVTIRAGDAASIPFTVSGAAQPQPDVFRGPLPPPMTLGANSIGGTPTTPGTYPVTIRLYDLADMSTVDADTTIVVTPALDFTLSSSVSPVGRGEIGRLTTITAAAQNAVGTVTYSVVPISGRMASLSSANLTMTAQGVISGTPTATFTGTANIRLTENNGGVLTTVDKALELDIRPVAVATAQTDLPVITGFSASEMMAKLYDQDPFDPANIMGKSHVAVPTSTQMTYTYSRPVTVNGISAQHLGSAYAPVVRIENITPGSVATLFNSSVEGGQANFQSSTGTAFRITYQNGVTANVAAMALTFDGAHAAYPYISSYMNVARNGGSGANADLGSDNRIQAPMGRSITITPSVFNASGEVNWSYTNNLPAGLTFDSSTGAISGTPTAAGTLSVTIYATDSRNLTSVGHPIQFFVEEAETAATVLPSVDGPGNPATAIVAMYDADPYDQTSGDGSSTVTLAANQTITFTFPTPTRVNGATFYKAATAGNASNMRLELRNVDQNKTLIATTSTYSPPYAQSFTDQGPSTTYTLRNASGATLTLANFALTYGARSVPLPAIGESLSVSTENNQYFTQASIRSKVVGVVGQTLAVRPVVVSNTGASGYVWSYTGTVPPGMSFNNANGHITGQPSTPGEFSMALVATNNDGISTIPKTVRISIGALETVATALPTISGVADSAFALKALYEPDPYEATAEGPGKITVQNNDVITYTFDRPRRAGGIVIQRAYRFSGTPSLAVQVTNNDTGVVLPQISVGTSGLNLPFSEVQTSQSFSIRIVSATAVDIGAMMLSFNTLHPTVGYINETIELRKNNGATTYPSLRTRIDIVNGQQLRIQPFALGGPLTNWSYTGLPSSLAGSVNASTGLVSGPANVAGTYNVTVKGTDPNGIETFSKPITIRITP